MGKMKLEVGDDCSTVVSVSNLQLVDVFYRLMEYYDKDRAYEISMQLYTDGQYQDPDRAFGIVGSNIGCVNERYNIIGIKGKVPLMLERRVGTTRDCMQEKINNFTLNGKDKLFSPLELCFIANCIDGMCSDSVNTVVKKMVKALILLSDRVTVLMKGEDTNE